jgi:hypothetical protein
MNRTRSAWLSTALLCGALLAGCGSSSSTTTSTASSTPAAATQSTPATTSTSTATAPSTTTPGAPSAGVPTSSAGRFAAAICKSTTARAKLPITLKAQVEAICHDYEKGDTAKARVDAEKACTEAVEAIPNESPQKQQALARCKGK